MTAVTLVLTFSLVLSRFHQSWMSHPVSVKRPKRQHLKEESRKEASTLTSLQFSVRRKPWGILSLEISMARCSTLHGVAETQLGQSQNHSSMKVCRYWCLGSPKLRTSETGVEMLSGEWGPNIDPKDISKVNSGRTFQKAFSYLKHPRTFHGCL